MAVNCILLTDNNLYAEFSILNESLPTIIVLTQN